MSRHSPADLRTGPEPQVRSCKEINAWPEPLLWADEKAFAFVADPGNLPRSAIGFAKAIPPDGDAWLVTTGQGQVRLRAVKDADIGIVDFHMTVGGVEAVAYSRVLARGEACEYVFTQMQPPGLPHDVFDD